MFDKKLEYFVALLYAWGSSIASRVCLWSLSASTGDSCSSDFRILAFRSDFTFSWNRYRVQPYKSTDCRPNPHATRTTTTRRFAVAEKKRHASGSESGSGSDPTRPADADSDPELHTDSDSISDLNPDSELGSWPGAWFTKYLTTILRDLTIMPKLRSTYDRRLIHKTSYEGRQAFVQVQFA